MREHFGLEAADLTGRGGGARDGPAADNLTHHRIDAEAVGVVHILVLGKAAVARLAQGVPGLCPTVGHLAINVSPPEGKRAGPPGRLPRSEISRRVAMTVAEQIGLPLEEVQEDSRFNEDLWLDQ